MNPVQVLLVGCGGREHAIALALARSSIEHDLHCVGPYRNPELFRMSVTYGVAPLDHVEQIVQFATGVKPDLCIIGPEKPLFHGVVDALRRAGFRRCIGPPRSIAKVESDKGWCREMLTKYGLNRFNPQYRVFDGFEVSQQNSTKTSETHHWTQIGKDERFQRLMQWDEVKAQVLQMIKHLKGKYVIKPLGSSGVMVSGDHLLTIEDGLKYCHSLFQAKEGFVVEEKIVGREFSLLSITDGTYVNHFVPVHDFKRAYNGDLGPNTEGMGCISHASNHSPWLTAKHIEEAHNLTQKMVRNIAYEFPSETWSGVMSGGFIALEDNTIRLLEYNMRFGDPEALNVLFSSTIDLLELFLSATTPRMGLKFTSNPVSNQPTCTIYICPKTYPNKLQETVYIHYQEIFEILLKNVRSSIFLIAAGLSVDCDDNSVVPSIAGNIWANAKQRVAIAEDGGDVLNKKARITGARTFALLAIGNFAIEDMVLNVFPRLRSTIGDVFKWRSDITHHLVRKHVFGEEATKSNQEVSDTFTSPTTTQKVRE